MELINSISYLKDFQKVYSQEVSGFIPTMGALHDGHLSLIRKAKEECGYLICSIFVNPTQFNDADDLLKYPRTLDADLKKLKSLGVDMVYLPEVKDIYPDGAKSEIYDLKETDEGMEGAHRPGHFQGVATVVDRLIKQVKPNRMYLGQKDLQQFKVISAMVEVVGHNIDLIMCPIIREPNGLAMSSRNERLTPEARQGLGVIYDTLCYVKEKYETSDIDDLKEEAVNRLIDSPYVKSVEYFEIVDALNIKPIKSANTSVSSLACVALQAEDVRLIDNMSLIS